MVHENKYVKATALHCITMRKKNIEFYKLERNNRKKLRVVEAKQ